MEQKKVWCQLEAEGSSSNTGVISQCLFQCLLGCRRGGTFAGWLSIRGIQSCAGHSGRAQDSNTAVVRTHCLSLPFPP